jgi:3-isopropylmalate/(R)-2-methylmalate dehydratase small subunit
MGAITQVQGHALPLRGDDIDTDRIMPARFLVGVSFEGLEKHVFEDDRKAAVRPHNRHPFDVAQYQGASVLIVNSNFGCGSSREHAPWALVDFGIRAVISTAIADIFRNNSLKNGLVPVLVDSSTHEWLLGNPGADVTVDIEKRLLKLPGGREITFPIDGFSRYCLLNGLDQMGFLLESEAKIKAFEEQRA